MRQYVELGVLANWVSMIRAETAGAIWLPDDDHEARFYERCAHQSSRVVPAAGAAIGLLAAVKQRGVLGVVAVVREAGVVTSIQDGVFRPGTGDVASLLVLSTAYERVIRDLAGTTWVTACKGCIGELRCRAVSIARAFRRAITRNPNLTWDNLAATIDWSVCQLRLDAFGQLCGGWLPGGVEESWSDLNEPSFRAALVECDGMDVLDVVARAIDKCTPHGIKESYKS